MATGLPSAVIEIQEVSLARMTRMNVGSGFDAAACAAFFEAEVSDGESEASSSELGGMDFEEADDIADGVDVLVAADVGTVL